MAKKIPSLTHLHLAIALLAPIFFTPGALALDNCGPTPATHGGGVLFDYWTDRDKLPLVEEVHFPPQVEFLRAGNTGSLGGDIGYTLMAIPNHPRALVAMINLSEREKKDRPYGAKYSAECFLDRAIRYRPNDATVRMIYGSFLAKKGRNEEALQQLQVAKENAEDSANLYYNLGLVYFNLKRYDESLEFAHKAYERGFSLPGLKQKLQKAGKWRDMPANAANSTAEPGKSDSAAQTEKSETK